MTAFFSNLNFHIDGFLIYFYRLTGHAFVDYIIGTFCLAFFCVVIGEMSVSLALKFNRRYFDEMNAEMLTKEKLSLQAYKAGDVAGYKALNKEATDVWGRRFFTMVGYSAGILWPTKLSMASSEYTQRSSARLMAMPVLSSLAVRPMRCTYASGSCGRS